MQIFKKFTKKNKLSLKEKIKDIVSKDRESSIKIKEEQNGFSNGKDKKK